MYIDFYMINKSTFLNIIYALLLVACVQQIARGQHTLTNTPSNDTLALGSQHETGDSLKADTTSAVDKTPESLETQWGIKIAKDALPSIVKTHAEDSTIILPKEKAIYLHGEAKIEYEDLILQAGHTKFDNTKKELTAYPSYDTTGKHTSLQQFEQGEEKFIYDTLRYNFESKRAIVRNARMQYGEGFIQSQQVKRNKDGSIYGWRNIYTTCNIPDHPHFGIRANRIKQIPNSMTVSGPANIEIQEIPTPLFLPFAIFPNNKQQKSGFILPSYTMEANRGMGLQKGGYFFMINPHVNSTVLMDVFSKGSWGIFTSTQYTKRYKYNGTLSLSYSYTKWGEDFETTAQRSRDFKVNWSHQMNPKARPGTTFSAAVDFGTSNYNLINGMNANTVLNNTYYSSVSYGKSWIGKPYTFNAAFRHNQSTQTGLVNVYLPEMSFYVGQFSPFQSKNSVGTPKWYEKINLSYTAAFKNKVSFYDSLINELQTQDLDYGLSHNINLQANYNVLKYFTLSFTAPYTEYWNSKQEIYQYNPNLGRDDTIANQGFYASRYFNVTANLNTRIYGMFMFKKGPLKGIRHVMMPSIGLSYTPSFARDPFNYMYTYVNESGQISYRSPYTGSPIGGPSNYEERGSITFSLDNTLQAKKRTVDSTTSSNKSIINLIDGLSVNGAYNMIADTNKLSDIQVRFRTLLFKKLNLSSTATFVPYKYENGVRTKYYLWNTDKKLAQMQNFNLNLGISFDGTNKTRGTERDTTDLGNDEDNETYRNMMRNGGYNDYYDFNIPWNLTINGGLRIYRQWKKDGGDTIIYSPNLTFSGGLNLTERWKITAASGIDFTNLKHINLGYTQLTVVRDLHCWQMSLNLVPFGQLRSFYFSLNVKASILQDLKLTRRRSFQDNYY